MRLDKAVTIQMVESQKSWIIGPNIPDTCWKSLWGKAALANCMLMCSRLRKYLSYRRSYEEKKCVSMGMYPNNFTVNLKHSTLIWTTPGQENDSYHGKIWKYVTFNSCVDERNGFLYYTGETNLYQQIAAEFKSCLQWLFLIINLSDSLFL